MCDAINLLCFTHPFSRLSPSPHLVHVSMLSFMITVLGMITNVVNGNNLSIYSKYWKKRNPQLRRINLFFTPSSFWKEIARIK